MCVTKKYLSRRTLLRVLGVSLTLPPLDSRMLVQTSLRKTAAAARVRLKAETPEEKFNRISAIVRNIMLTGYPNPGRAGCPGQRYVENLAQYGGDFKELRKQEHYQHVMHCSPCYGQYLDAKRELWALDTEDGPPLQKGMQKEIGRRLDRLDRMMRSVTKELKP
jgi:hypothetical protein